MSDAEPPKYTVRLRSRRVQRELDRLQEADSQRILVRLKALSDDPRPPGCEKLDNEIYRVRAGDIRIIYAIDDSNKRVDVGAIRRRSETTYRRVEDLFR
jgi:mRNA interferase RelE/StbE